MSSLFSGKIIIKNKEKELQIELHNPLAEADKAMEKGANDEGSFMVLIKLSMSSPSEGPSELVSLTCTFMT